jgi:large subunit ribosomal protein L6
MSRIGILPVKIESGVEVNVAGSTVTVKGPKGELSIETPDFLDVKVDDGHVKVTRTKEFKQAKAMHGTVRSLINGMIEGVGKGFTKELTIEGVGYRAAMKGSQLVMSVGYSHPIEYDIMDGVEVKVDKDTSITVTGIDKQKVGQTAARIRAFAPAEPYKGKGIKYKGEKIRRKAGKTVA